MERGEPREMGRIPPGASMPDANQLGKGDEDSSLREPSQRKSARRLLWKTRGKVKLNFYDTFLSFYAIYKKGEWSTDCLERIVNQSLLSLSLRLRPLVDLYLVLSLSLRSRQYVDRSLMLSLTLRSRRLLDQSPFLARGS